MKKLGCLLALLGVATFALGFWWVAASLPPTLGQAWLSRSWQMQSGQAVTTKPFSPGESRHCQLGVKMRVRSPAVRKVEEGGAALQYRFPFEYHVFTEDGRELVGGQTHIEWSKGAQKWNDLVLDKDGGSAVLQQAVGDFRVPGTDNIKVTAKLGQDSEYEASASEIRLVVHCGISTSKSSQGDVGYILFFVGPGLALAGIIVFIIGLFSRRTGKVKSGDGGQ